MAEARFRPVGDRILVRRDQAPKMTATGALHIPDEFYRFEHPPEWGVVLAVGSGRVLRKRGSERVEVEGLKVGDRVLVGRFTGHDLEVGGQKVLISKIEDVLVIEEV